MIATEFEYLAPSTLDEAISLLSKHGDDAKLLAGGHSLIPIMKLRLSQPKYLIDIGRLPGLSDVREQNGTQEKHAARTDAKPHVEDGVKLPDAQPVAAVPPVAQEQPDRQDAKHRGHLRAAEEPGDERRGEHGHDHEPGRPRQRALPILLLGINISAGSHFPLAAP